MTVWQNTAIQLGFLQHFAVYKQPRNPPVRPRWPRLLIVKRQGGTLSKFMVSPLGVGAF